MFVSGFRVQGFGFVGLGVQELGFIGFGVCFEFLLASLGL